MIIGLTGKSCSGKNLVAEFLVKRGFECVDLDLEVHGLHLKLKDTLIQHFGNTILDPEGRIDRRILGNLVFRNPPLLKELEDILYPELHKIINRFIDNSPPENHIVINAAALEKGDFWKRCDAVLWVHAPLLIRLYRACKRDHRPLLHIIRRFAVQKELKSQFFLSRVDTYIIRNGFTRSVLQKRVDSLIKHLPPER